MHGTHRGKVDHQAAVADCAAAYIVAATTDSEEQIVFPGELYALKRGVCGSPVTYVSQPTPTDPRISYNP
jgi:hypothetical protein